MRRHLFLLPSAILHGIHAFIVPQVRQIHLSHLSGSSDGNDASRNEAENLLKYASRLRQEAESLESSMSEKRILSNTTVKALEVAAYSQLSGSYWTLAYRFSPEPIEITEESNDSRVRFFSGKVKIHLRSDGYTDFLNQDSDIQQFTKFWGWDEEVSTRDEKRYLMFSADIVQTPSNSSTSTIEKTGTSRFYFNARIDDEKSAHLELVDGVVTVKRDVLSNPPRLLRLFNAGSILAEFKNCGTFICKPCLPFR